MVHTRQTVTDKEGYTYQLEVNGDDYYFTIGLYDDHAQVGRAVYLLHPDTLELTDIVIWEKPVFFRKGLWRLVPYNLYCRLKRKDYRRRGLGTELLKAVIAQAREANVSHIRGFVNPDSVMDNPKLLEWYQKHGFTVIPVSSGSKTNKRARIEMDL